MPTWRNTDFTWQHHRGGTDREDYGRDEARVAAVVNLLARAEEGPDLEGVNVGLLTRQQAAYDLLGFAGVLVASPGGRRYVSRVTPMSYPPAGPGLILPPPEDDGAPLPDQIPYLWASSLNGGEGVGEATMDSQGRNYYREYRCTLAFTPRRYQIKEDEDVLAGPPTPTKPSPLSGLPDEGWTLAYGGGYGATRYIFRQARFGTRNIMLREGVMRFVTGSVPPTAGGPGVPALPGTPGPPVGEGFPVPEPWIRVEYTHSELPWPEAVPYRAIARILGQRGMNNTGFDFIPDNQAGTMFFQGYEDDIYFSPLGRLYCDLKLQFVYSPKWNFGAKNADGTDVYVTHNHALRNVGNQLIYDYVNDTGFPGPPFRTVYNGVDFADLFRPDPA